MGKTVLLITGKARLHYVTEPDYYNKATILYTFICIATPLPPRAWHGDLDAAQGGWGPLSFKFVVISQTRRLNVDTSYLMNFLLVAEWTCHLGGQHKARVSARSPHLVQLDVERT